MAAPRPTPTQVNLHEAALAHLARYATTAAGLIRVLDRRVDRWAREAQAEDEAVKAARGMVRAVAAALVAAGLIDDTAFAASRARSLNRSGKSRRGIAAHLAARGVAGAVLREVLPDNPAAELAAAVALARRRRIGPFGTGDTDPAIQRRALGMLARAGFPQPVAQQALDMAPEEAEALLAELRRT